MMRPLGGNERETILVKELVISKKDSLSDGSLVFPLYPGASEILHVYIINVIFIIFIRQNYLGLSE